MDMFWRPYVPVAQRRQEAAREVAKLAKRGRIVAPVRIEGRAIARTFWGKSWCENLERYSDFANRLPRGRTYVRNGSVVDLQIAAGVIEALVSGSSLYRVKITVTAVAAARWKTVCADCAGSVDSLVELLQGRLSEAVMARLCQDRTGLFPAPSEIGLSCSCPDWATMCKHVAAVLYGVGARLDERPELLFLLRKIDEKELIATAGKGVPLANGKPGAEKLLADEDLGALFGVELSGEPTVPAKAAAKVKPRTAAKVKPRTAAKAKPKAAAKAKPKAAANAKPRTAGKVKPKPPANARPKPPAKRRVQARR